jgi:hypothetical protein
LSGRAAEEQMMKSYTITVAPDEPPGATAVIQVAVSESGPLLKGFSLVAAEGQMLSASELSKFNSERLVSAVLPVAILMSGAEPGADETAGVAPGAPQLPAPAPSKTARSRRTASETRDDAVAAPEPVKARSPARRTTTQAGTATGKSAESRNYRLMPGDFFDRFGKSTMAELAEEYSVPLYTIQSWISTARKQGKLPPARERRARAR